MFTSIRQIQARISDISLMLVQYPFDIVCVLYNCKDFTDIVKLVCSAKHQLLFVCFSKIVKINFQMKLLISDLISVTSCDSFFSFTLTLQDEYLLVYMALRDYTVTISKKESVKRGVFIRRNLPIGKKNKLFKLSRFIWIP